MNDLMCFFHFGVRENFVNHVTTVTGHLENKESLMNRNTSRLALSFGVLLIGMFVVASASAALVTTGLVARFDATNVDGTNNSTLVNNSSVSSWVNIAPTGQQDGVASVIQATGTAQPKLNTNTLNGLSVMRFDGVDDLLQSTAFTTALAQSNQILAVWRAFSNGGSGSILVDGLSTGRNNATYEQGRIDMFAGGGSPPLWVMGSNATGTDGSALETTFLFDGASSSIRSTYNTVTQTNDPTATLKANGDAGTQSMDGVTLGARFAPFGGDQFGLDGYIAEILIYETPLTGTNLTDTESYLYNKWFVEVPEPSSLAILAIGTLPLLRRRHERR
jgi:hypothetical protein